MRIFGRKRPAAPWHALFVQSGSPGAVIRFLERRPPRAANNMPASLFLGEAAAGAQPWRALVAPGATPDAPDGAWMEKTGAALAAAFAPGVTLLFADDAAGAWGWRVWAAGTAGAAHETEHGSGEIPPAPTLAQRLAGHARLQNPTALAVTWAQARGLPAAGIPRLLDGRAGGRSVRLVAYETVAGLDARGLLREDGPRWYPVAGTR